MTDLHARLLASVTARRQLAEAARHEVWDVLPQWLPAAVGQHLAANSPAQILRDTEAHLATLADHQPCTDSHDDAVLMHWSAAMYWRHAPEPACHQHATPTTWPCIDIERLAGIYPEETAT